MTPREYSKNRKRPPFPQQQDTSKAHWKKLIGYLVVVDGTKKNIVQPSLMYDVVVDNGEIKLNSNWIFDKCMFGRIPLLASFRSRPYAYGALLQYTKRGLAEPCFKNMNFDDVMALVKRMYPDIYIPTKKEFYAEFGIEYDTKTKQLSNPLNLN